MPNLLHVQRNAQRSRICLQVGWKHQEAVKELEEVRKVRSKDYYAAKKKLQSLKTKAIATVEQA